MNPFGYRCGFYNDPHGCQSFHQVMTGEAVLADEDFADQSDAGRLVKGTFPGHRGKAGHFLLYCF